MGMRVNGGARHLLGAAALLTLVSCGGGGNAPGTPVFDGPGSGSPVFEGTPGGGGGTQTGDGTRPAADPTIVVSTAMIQGQVLSASTGSGIQGASVDLGSATLTTDSTGFYSQATFAATARLVMLGSGTGYESLYLPTTVTSGVPTVGVFNLTPQGTAATVSPAAGGPVAAADNVSRATLAANSLETAPGVPATGTVAVRLTPLGVGVDPYVASGDYTSTTSQPLEAFGAAVLETADSVSIVSSQPATLRIAVSSREASLPATANLYYLDTTTARWVQDGSATLTGNYYEGTVTRFGQWLVGLPITAPVTVQGCVVDDTGAPAANVRIAAEGIDYSGVAYVNTDAAGTFSVGVKPNSRLLIAGRRGAFLTNAISVDTLAATVNATPCLTLPSTNAATVRLTWGASPSDIDSHLLTPGGAHVYYVNRGSLSAEPFANLDVDDTTGFGPEVTTVRRPKAGVYRFYLYNYSGTFSPGMTASPTRVEFNYAGRTVVFTPPAGEGANRYWHLFDLDIGSNCSMTLYRYNRWRSDEPANPNAAGSTAQFCVPS